MRDVKKLVMAAAMLGAGDYFKGLEHLAWQNYEQAEKIYHVTPVSNVRKIQFAGLIGKSTGKIERTGGNIIWLFVNDATGHLPNMPDEVANSILLNWIDEGLATFEDCEYALFEVDKAILHPNLVIWDKVAEFCAIGSFGYQGQRIAAKHLRLVGVYHLAFELERQAIINVDQRAQTNSLKREMPAKS